MIREREWGVRLNEVRKSLVLLEASQLILPHAAKIKQVPGSRFQVPSFKLYWLNCMSHFSTAYCLLPTAYCLLPTAYCLLPTAYFRIFVVIVKILVAPLDWGLGHATRCVPIIRQLLARQHRVLLGGAGPSLRLLCQEFPDLETIQLPAYDIQYTDRGSLVTALLRQAPRLLRVVRDEHRILESLTAIQRPDAVISDNRYGLWSRFIPSVLITHQLHLPAPLMLRPFAQAMNRYLIGRFGECWVPDEAEAPGLAGNLSHPPLPGVKTVYLGPLSRFTKATAADPTRYDLAVILSGPEPQRSMLEALAIRQATKLNLRTVVVRGRPGDESTVSEPGNTEVVAHVPAKELENILMESKHVLSRSGYSSIMDYHALGRNAILVPTPGQQEQEYLATHFRRQKTFYSMSQKSFRLETALAESASYRLKPGMPSQLSTHLATWLQQLSSY